MTTSPCRHSPSLSRTGNVLHSSRESAFACLLFNKVEEVQHSIVIPSDSHSGINYPPFALANGFETTDCLECLQILDILIYGRRVCFRIWSSRTESVLHAPPLCSFRILTFLQKNIPLPFVKQHVLHRLESRRDLRSWACKNKSLFFRDLLLLSYHRGLLLDSNLSA